MIPTFVLSLLDDLLGLPGFISSPVTLSIWVSLGFFGNAAYRSHVHKKLRYIKVQELENDKEEALIREMGGTSIAGLVAFACWFFLLAFLFSFYRFLFKDL